MASKETGSSFPKEDNFFQITPNSPSASRVETDNSLNQKTELTRGQIQSKIGYLRKRGKRELKRGDGEQSANTKIELKQLIEDRNAIPLKSREEQEEKKRKRQKEQEEKEERIEEAKVRMRAKKRTWKKLSNRKTQESP